MTNRGSFSDYQIREVIVVIFFNSKTADRSPDINQCILPQTRSHLEHFIIPSLAESSPDIVR